MDTHKAITDVLMRPFPESAVKERFGGGNTKLKYVDNMTVRRRVIEATDNEFNFEILSYNIHTIGQKQMMLVHGRLTIPALNSCRDDFGVQLLNDRGGEDMWKGAVSDCFKRCAAAYGVAHELYGADLEALAAQMAADPLGTPAVGRSTPKATTKATTPRGRLAQRLKESGLSTRGQVDALSTERYGATFDKITDEQVLEWLDTLS